MQDLKDFRKDKKQLRILICSFYTYDIGIFIRACRLLGFRYEILYHGLDILQISAQLPKAFQSHSKNADRLIFNSGPTKDLFFEKLPNIAKDYKVVHPVLESEKILASETYTLSELEEKWQLNLSNKTIISCVTHLGKRKGVALAVSAMSKFREKFPDHILLIGGDGPEKENLERQIKTNDLSQNVKLLGFISDKEKFSLLKYSRIFVLPSSNLKGVDWEGFGISYIEASLWGNVVIGGNHGGITDAVIDGKTGWLIDFDSEDAVDRLYECLLDISEKDHEDMIKTGIEFVKKNFSIDSLEQKFL
jgi:glycosyltransferase involved in cell wall biosynthesis